MAPAPPYSSAALSTVVGVPLDDRGWLDIPEDWELRVNAANVARLARDVRRLEMRVTILEVKLGVYATLGGLVGGAAGALIVGLIVAQS